MEVELPLFFFYFIIKIYLLYCMIFFKNLFKKEEKPLMTDSDVTYYTVKTLLKDIFSNEELINIIKETSSKTACVELIDLYKKFKQIKKNRIEDLLLIAKCESLFYHNWDASFKNELITIYGNL